MNYTRISFIRSEIFLHFSFTSLNERPDNFLNECKTRYLLQKISVFVSVQVSNLSCLVLIVLLRSSFQSIQIICWFHPAKIGKLLHPLEFISQTQSN